MIHRTFFILLLCLLSGTVLAMETHGSYKLQDGIFSVPLTIEDNSGVARHSWPVTNGIPLPYGIVHRPESLRLTDERGNEIPCQFTVLSRYSERDQSVRWVLMDFQVDVPANGKTLVYLKNDTAAKAFSGHIAVDEEKTVIRVNTGPLEVTIPRERGKLIQSASVNGIPVIKAGADDGPSIRAGETLLAEHFTGSAWNTHGWDKTRKMEEIYLKEMEYSGAYSSPTNVTVEKHGPLHTVILVRGTHMPQQGGKGVRDSGYYNYSTRLHFYYNKSFIKVEHSIENSDRSQPQWNLMFHEAGINHSLVLDDTVTVTGGGDPQSASFNIPGNSTAWLYQGAASSEKKFGKTRISEGTYRFGLSTDGTIAQPRSSGRHARFLDISDGKKGLAVASRYFWQEAPRAIAASARQLRIILQADNPGYTGKENHPRQEYDLDFGERSIFDILYYFHQGGASGARIADTAEAFEYPLFAYAPTEWYSDSETWYFELARKPLEESARKGQEKHWMTTSAGWRNHGYNHGYNSGGHHESLNSGWLPFLRSGSLAELEKNLVLSRWAISHNPGWVYQDNILTSGSGDHKYDETDKQLKEWNRLTGYGPKDFYIWQSDKYTTKKIKNGAKEKRRGGSTYLNRYKWLPDHEHYALFRLFEYYYLSGDQRAIESINGFVDWAMNFQHKHMFEQKMPPLEESDYFIKNPEALRRGHYSRVYTWMLYTTLAGLHTTGSNVMADFSIWQVRRMLALLRHRHGQLTSWKNKPARILGLLPDKVQEILSNKTDADIFKADEEILTSRAQTWMEAQGILALHEAYKTYDDERILDGIWALADYFSHHVIFYPQLGMINNRTSMPNKLMGSGEKRGASLNPARHERHIQGWPILYHYTGWSDVKERYDNFEEKRSNEYTRDWFLQTGYWQRENRGKHSDKPASRISDLRVVKTGKDGITLQWTSPEDDGPSGHAERYFVKYSTKPITEFAPTDNPARSDTISSIVREAEQLVLSRIGNKKKASHKDLTIRPGEVSSEAEGTVLADPDWHNVNSFWMAEHVAGEPAPSMAGATERFTIKKIRPHNRFGIADADLNTLEPGTYYLAICTWDSDHNLSKPSNVVSVKID